MADGTTLATLQARLGVTFNDPGLLAQALTHSSMGGAHNERLEYLGDALLGFVIAERLYEAHGAAAEGTLTRWRATLVRKSTLAQVARELELGTFLRLGGSALKSGARSRDSILADTFEAVLGAVLLDRGFASCKDLVLRLFSSRLAQVAAGPPVKDAKTRLQEWLQGRGLPLPRYEVVSVQGPDHARRYQVSCLAAAIGSEVLGSGNSRQTAEQAAASAVLEALHA